MRSPISACALFSVLLSIFSASTSPGKASVLALRGLTFANEEARRIFEGYVEFLGTDPDRFANHLSTIRQLQASEIHYELVMIEEAGDGIEGRVTTDGRSVFIHLTHVGGPHGEVASMNSRLAHELEHARQFDSGEIAFARDPATGRWGPLVATYDIGDDVKAWEAQLVASVGADFFDRARGTGVIIPSLLRLFADAGGFEARASVLMANGYTDLRPIVNSNVGFAAKAKLAAGTVVHPGMRENFFGRVHGTPIDVARPAADSTVATRSGQLDASDPAHGAESWQ